MTEADDDGCQCPNGRWHGRIAPDHVESFSMCSALTMRSTLSRDWATTRSGTTVALPSQPFINRDDLAMVSTDPSEGSVDSRRTRDLISTPARANIGQRRRKLMLNEPSQSTASAQQPRERDPGRCRLLRSANIVSQSTSVRFAFRLSGVKRETTLRKS